MHIGTSSTYGCVSIQSSSAVQQQSKGKRNGKVQFLIYIRIFKNIHTHAEIHHFRFSLYTIVLSVCTVMCVHSLYCT